MSVRALTVVTWIVTGIVPLLVACEAAPAEAPIVHHPQPCVPDPAKHDEDLDGFPDSCDTCPIVADPLQLDTSEAELRAFPDGVGDACDLSPGLSGDDLAVLHTFSETAAAEAWMGTGWTVRDDQAHTTGGNWLAVDSEPGDGLQVQARIESWGEAGEIRIGADGDAIGRGHRCTLFRDRDGDMRDELEVVELGGATASTTVPVMAGDFRLTIWRFIDHMRTGHVICQVDRATGRYRTRVTTVDLTNGEYGLVATESISLSAVIVYTQPASQCAEPARCPRPGGP